MAETQSGIRKFPRFRGRFFTWRATIFVDQDNRFKSNFLVFSSGKREAVLEYLWHKLVWDSLTRIEYELFILTLKDNEYKKWNFLKFLLEYDKVQLRKRLISAETILGSKISSREKYLGYKGISIEIQKETRRLPKTKKFSGYIKSLASRNKSPRGESRIELDSMSKPDFVVEEDQDYLWGFLLKPSLDPYSEQG